MCSRSSSTSAGGSETTKLAPAAGPASAAKWDGGSAGEGRGEIDQLSDQPGCGQAGEAVGDLGAGVLAVSYGGMGVQRHVGLGLQEVEHAGDEHAERLLVADPAWATG